MIKFKKGDRVIRSDTAPPVGRLIAGGLYVVAQSTNPRGYIALEGVGCNFQNQPYYYPSDHFTLVPETETEFQTVTVETTLQHKVTLSVSVSGIATITAGCFTGTFDAAYTRSKGRKPYIQALDMLKLVAKASDLPMTERKPQPGEVWLLSGCAYLVTQDGPYIRLVDIKTGRLLSPISGKTKIKYGFASVKDYYDAL